MILALENGAAERPYFLDESATSISLKAYITSRKSDSQRVKMNVALINKMGRAGAEENAQFLAFACNTIDRAMKIVEFLWNMRGLLDDSGYGKQEGEAVVQSPELIEMVMLAEQLLYPKNGMGLVGPRESRVRPQIKPPERVAVKPPTPPLVPTKQPVVPLAPVAEKPPYVPPADDPNLPAPVEFEDELHSTPRKIYLHLKELKSKNVHPVQTFAHLPPDLPEDEGVKK